MRGMKVLCLWDLKKRVKRAGVQLEQESLKKQKIAVEDVPVTEEKVEVVKKEEPIKRTGKKKKKKDRKGTHADKTTKHEAKERPEELVKGNKGVCQIIREDGTYITYINFGTMFKSISRDDLIELYRLDDSLLLDYSMVKRISNPLENYKVIIELVIAMKLGLTTIASASWLKGDDLLTDKSSVRVRDMHEIYHGVDMHFSITCVVKRYLGFLGV
ncbi:hypothetical protein Tco_0974674 [Tanacetum coccineum]|uniref:Uncharacterized protein n=1 Tax=Tanacetum coccineum TaxID=301880 RepID=A0ABQ5ECD1_9ASTR